VVVPRVSVMVSLQEEHLAFHLFAVPSTVNSLKAKRTTSGAFCLIVTLTLLVSLSQSVDTEAEDDMTRS